MEVEKYMIHVGDVLEDPDMCFAHLLEGKEKKETLQGIQNCVRNIGKGWWNKEDWSVFLTILKTGICRESVKKENIYLM